MNISSKAASFPSIHKAVQRVRSRYKNTVISHWTRSACYLPSFFGFGDASHCVRAERSLTVADVERLAWLGNIDAAPYICSAMFFAFRVSAWAALHISAMMLTKVRRDDQHGDDDDDDDDGEDDDSNDSTTSLPPCTSASSFSHTGTGSGHSSYPTSWTVSGGGTGTGWQSQSWTQTSSSTSSSGSGAAVGSNADLSTNGSQVSGGSIAGIVIGVGKWISLAEARSVCALRVRTTVWHVCSSLLDSDRFRDRWLSRTNVLETACKEELTWKQVPPTVRWQL